MRWTCIGRPGGSIRSFSGLGWRVLKFCGDFLEGCGYFLGVQPIFWGDLNMI